MLSCPGGWGRGCLGPCLTWSRECPLMAVGTRGAGWMGWAAGSGRAWDLALGPNLLQASPFPSLSLSFLLLSGETWLGEGGGSKHSSRDGETEAPRAPGRGWFPALPRAPAPPLPSASPGPPPPALTLRLSDCLSLSVHLFVFLHLPVSPFLYLSLLPAFPSVSPHYSSVCLSFTLSPLCQSDSFLSSLSASVCMFVSFSLSDSSSSCLLSPHLTVCLFPCLSHIPCLSLSDSPSLSVSLPRLSFLSQSPCLGLFEGLSPALSPRLPVFLCLSMGPSSSHTVFVSSNLPGAPSWRR